MDFELDILRSLISDGEYFNKCFNLLNDSYFKNFGNKELFKLLKSYYIQYKQRPETQSLGIMIKDVPNEEVRKTIVESVKNLQKTPLNSNSKFMQDETVKFVKDAIFYRALELGSDGLTEKDDSKMKKAQMLMEEMAKVQIDSDLGINFDDIDKQIEYYSKREYGVRTQHKAMNKRLGSGYLPGTLSVFLSSAGGGKSLCLCDMISGMIQNNKNCLFVSCEMSPNEIIKRVQANVFNIDINSFRDLSKTAGELAQLGRNPTTKDQVITAYEKYKASGHCGKLYVKEYPAGSFSALMLADLIEKFKIEKGIKFDIVFVDYLGICKSDLVSPNVGLYSYVKSIAEEFRAQAVKLEIPLISCQQLNRSAINKTDGVDNSAISDSLGVSMTADMMCFILSTEEMKQKGEILMKFTKNRFTGITDSFLMNIDYAKMRFSDVIDTAMPNQSIDNSSDGFKTNAEKINAENFAKKEISEIHKQSMQNIKEIDKSQSLQDTDWTSILGI